MTLKLGFSPCPNDTFIFDGLVNRKIDTHGIDFEVFLEDVETLNQWALEGRLDITKLSFPAFFPSLDNYVLLNAGSALGKGAGPLLISKQEVPANLDELKKKSIAIPGKNTTANLLLSFAIPGSTNRVPMIFSDIENAVLSGKTELGVIIHENRFTYQEKGLIRILDLGEVWETQMGLPIPLGGIAASRRLGRQTAMQVDQLIRRSLEYAFEHHPSIPDYVREHAQEMNESVMLQHIDLYVNRFSLDLGPEGRQAIDMLHSVFISMNEKRIVERTAELFL